MTNTAFVWDSALADYRFTPGHPFNPRRLELTLALMEALHLFDGNDFARVAPRMATDEELLTIHAPEFIAAVKQEKANLDFGLGTEDVPVFPGMHEASALLVGATLTAAEEVMSGRVKRAFSMGSGLHHALRSKASGFCVYNDLAIAIRWLQQKHGARVMYVDYDAHHGDGVQWLFYTDPEVLTVSYHESGAFLFPGTGFIDEIGEGDGYGFSVNVPLEPHTGDASWLRVFDDLLPKVADAFRPDVIVLMNGVDGHALDPLTHLQCSTGLFEVFVQRVMEIADKHCEGRIVATGGGGYAIYDVVPRAWSLVWAALRGIELPDEVPGSWLQQFEREAGHALPRMLRDVAPIVAGHDDDMNYKTMRAVMNRVMPLLTGWGLAF